MIVGVPREIKKDEYRVAMLPFGVEELTRAGHHVLVERGAGLGSGIPDDMYSENGAEIVGTAAEIFARAEMVIKVKEPLPQEYPLIRSGQTLFTYFHFAADRALTDAMLKSGATCLAYETLNAMTMSSLKKAGRSFSPDGRHAGITPMLGQFLQQAQCESIQQAAYVLDLSAGTEAHGSMYQNSMAFFRLIEPFLLNMQVTTQEEFEELYNRMLAEVLSDSFRAVSFILTAWGQTPS